MSTETRNGPAGDGTVSKNHVGDRVHPEYIATPRQLHRRRAASWRLQRCCDHCGARDPICCRCRTPELTADSAVAAADHLKAIGLAPLYSIRQCRTLWRAGRRDLATRCSTEVAA